MSEQATNHRALAVGYFNATWELVDATDRTAEQDRDMLTTAFASRRHWIDAGGTDENLTIADWQVAHAASLAGFGDIAVVFARSAADRAETAGVATWLLASTQEGMARAFAATGDREGYERHAARCRELLTRVDDAEDRNVVEGQLASIPPP